MKYKLIIEKKILHTRLPYNTILFFCFSQNTISRDAFEDFVPSRIIVFGGGLSALFFYIDKSISDVNHFFLLLLLLLEIF